MALSMCCQRVSGWNLNPPDRARCILVFVPLLPNTQPQGITGCSNRYLLYCALVPADIPPVNHTRLRRPSILSASVYRGTTA